MELIDLCRVNDVPVNGALAGSMRSAFRTCFERKNLKNVRSAKPTGPNTGTWERRPLPPNEPATEGR